MICMTKIQHTRFLNAVYRSASALGSHLPSISSAKDRVAGASALLRPVSNSTQVVMKQAQSVAQTVVRTHSFSSWTCIGSCRRTVGNVGNVSSPEEETTSRLTPESMVIERVGRETTAQNEPEPLVSDYDEAEDDELLHSDNLLANPPMKELSQGDLWFELEKELYRHDEDVRAQEEAAAAAKEITELETEVLKEAAEIKQQMSLDNVVEASQFYPPGRIMHMVMVPASGADSSDDSAVGENRRAAFYETPRHLYSKIRLAASMINDHYMPLYRKMMEQLIDELGQDEDSCCTEALL